MSNVDDLDALLTDLCELEQLLRSAIEPYRLALNKIGAVKSDVRSRVKQGVKGAVKGPFTTAAPVSAHRRAHRPGRARKIDTDHELRAFIEARIDRMTFMELAEEVAAQFPKPRRVGKSAIYDWWKASNKSR